MIRTRLLLKNTWTASLEKDDGLTEPLIMLACPGFTAICELTQGQIGELFAPESVDAAHFNPWKRQHWIQKLVWHKWIHVREWLPGQRMDEMTPGKPGYTDWHSRNRDLVRHMYIMGTQPRGRGVHRSVWMSMYHRDPVGTGCLGEINGEAQPIAVGIIHAPDQRNEKDILNILNVSVHTEEKHRLAY